MTPREEAEAIEQFGDDLRKLIVEFDRVCNSMSPDAVEQINAVPHQEHMEPIARAFQALGDRLSRDCDAAEEADDRRRSNPLEPGYRPLA